MVLKHVQPKEEEMKQKLRNTKAFWTATSGNRSVCPPCVLTPLSFIPYQSKNREEQLYMAFDALRHEKKDALLLVQKPCQYGSSVLQQGYIYFIFPKEKYRV